VTAHQLVAFSANRAKLAAFLVVKTSPSYLDPAITRPKSAIIRKICIKFKLIYYSVELVFEDNFSINFAKKHVLIPKF
jgi:hypothetical protein